MRYVIALIVAAAILAPLVLWHRCTTGEVWSWHSRMCVADCPFTGCV